MSRVSPASPLAKENDPTQVICNSGKSLDHPNRKASADRPAAAKGDDRTAPRLLAQNIMCERCQPGCSRTSMRQSHKPGHRNILRCPLAYFYCAVGGELFFRRNGGISTFAATVGNACRVDEEPSLGAIIDNCCSLFMRLGDWSDQGRPDRNLQV